jgi:cytoskeletal protein RodZ
MAARRILAVAVMILCWVDRLPAPIVEEEKPTPTPERTEPSKRKRSRSITTEQSSGQTETQTKAAPAPGSQKPARFTGTWTGKVNQGLLGHVPTSVTVDSTATLAAVRDLPPSMETRYRGTPE